MYEELKSNLRQWVNCSEAELESFLTIAQPSLKTYKRKELIQREGQISTYLYFIKSGCIRYYFLKDGEERTGQFFFENGWYTDLGSFLTQQPSEENVQALEPTELLLISKQSLYQIYEQVPIFERFGRVLLEQSFVGARLKNKRLANLSPEEHYKTLIKERPKVMQRVSLQHIASYLGIKPESLSRIRKRMFDTKRNS